MAMHRTPADHDADPPSGWTVRKHGRKFALCNKDGHPMQYCTTRREAEALKTSGFYFNLYNDEGRWFCGESVRNWKQYQPR